MPRPMKWRKVCCLPNNNRFGPLDISIDESNHILMTVEEYETIRLIDMEELTQVECSLRMDVARTTVQGIYESARKKLADSLVNGKMIIIQGGNYALCDGTGSYCGDCNTRHRHHRGRLR